MTSLLTPGESVEPGPPVSAARTWWARLPAAVRATLPVWFASRVGVAVLSYAAARVAVEGALGRQPTFLALWDRWDVGLFTKVARYGYVSPHYADQTEVDFPAFPLAIRLVHLFTRSWLASGLIVVFLAGAVAMAAIWRLAADEDGPEAGRAAVLAAIFAPYAVFLFAGYSEALFLAFASTAWLAGRRGHWWVAGLLAAGATGTRITGIPLWCGLVVLYLVERRSAGQPVLARPAFALALPPLPVFGFLWYLHGKTGEWNAYTVAMRAGWHRWTDWPWSGWRATWHSAFPGPDGSTTFTWFWRAELLAVVLGVVVTILLLRGRRWAEATFVGTATLLMAATNYYASGVRTMLVAFPVYLLLARLAGRYPRLAPAYLWLSGPVMAAFVVAFTQGHWVD
ncbi:hypothetical protein [Pseudofrankia inefficax]|uniref:Integral membrane protein n=1 Tax=Pseudofrankia inefficax (strain DSM 45817 / CECT 9037 / DDB 130130 / EuI1c) TaxID=298654 RepID=E3IZU0_PSEI1|nr:hypothetical protein FraEuI1c_7168 [Pseudofrankia inefficax]